MSARVRQPSDFNLRRHTIVYSPISAELGRNDPCACGSGKKYKKCCLGSDAGNTVSASQAFDRKLSAAQELAGRQQFEQAAIAFRELLSYGTNDIVLASLGQCLCQLHRVAEGVPYLYKAGNLLLLQAKKSGQAGDLFALIYQLIHWHAFEEALELARAALTAAPDSQNAHHLAALSLQGLNRLPDALIHATKAARLVPMDSNAQILAATLEAKSGNLSDARQRLEAIVKRDSDPNLGRACLELGVIMDKAYEFEHAFEYLNKAGTIALASPEAQRIDKSAVYREIDQLRVAFNPEFNNSAPQRVLADGLPSPVFLIGFYRSGSTLAEQILAAHPLVSTTDETHLIGFVQAEMRTLFPQNTSMAEQIQTLDSAQIGHLRAHYWAVARRLLGEKVVHRTLVDKTTLNTLNIELMNVLFPDAKVVYTVRDPRDICLSCVSQSFVLSPLTVHLLTWPDCVRLYAAVTDYWLSVRDSLALSWTELRYEEVVMDLEGQFRSVFQELGLEWSAACLNFYQQAQQRKAVKTPSFDQVNRPLYASSVGRWRNYLPYIDAFLPTLQPYITRYRY